MRNLCGELAALWFFFLTRNESKPTSPFTEWSSLRSDHRDHFGFAREIESREWLDVSTRLCRETNLIRGIGGAQSEKHPSPQVHRIPVSLSGPRRAQLGVECSRSTVCSSWCTRDPGCARVCSTLHATRIWESVVPLRSVVCARGFL